MPGPRKSRNVLVTVWILAIIALLCPSCGSKQSRYYMLSSSADLAPLSESAEPVTVGVGPINLPDYLMRPEIVTRQSAGEIDLSEFHRWAEPLDKTVSRVLFDNLSSLLPGSNLLSHPWNRAIHVDYRIKVDVTGFEQQPDGAVLLAANWNLLDGDGKMLRKDKTRIKVAVADQTYQAVVSAMNTAMAELSGELASALSGVMP
jgi:uncharacterized lipoprotein YmbA